MQLRLAALAFALSAAPAFAQTPAQMPAMPQGQADMMKMMVLGAHNQLGVLEYCQAQGSVGDDVVALQKKMIAMLPPGQVDGTDAAEAAGKRGVVQFGGNEVALDQAAKVKNATADSMCKQMGQMLTAQASQLSGQMPTMPGAMPTAPGATPAMPGAMPAMPAMPK